MGNYNQELDNKDETAIENKVTILEIIFKLNGNGVIQERNYYEFSDTNQGNGFLKNMKRLQRK